MSIPYFYVLKHIPSSKYYAGCKINSSADPNNLMKPNGYKTSSKIIKKLIEIDGIDSFIILKIKKFNLPEEALKHETLFLKKVNASKNSRFLNLHNGGIDFVNNGGYSLKEYTKNKMKKPKSKETILKQNSEKRKRSKETYKKMVETRRRNNELWNDKETRIKISNNNIIRFSCESERERISKIMKEYYQKNPVSDETKKKLSDINSGCNNKMYGKKHSESTRQKMKIAWEKRKLENLSSAKENNN